MHVAGPAVEMRKIHPRPHPVKMAVTTQPRSNRKEAESFVKELDPEIVQGNTMM